MCIMSDVVRFVNVTELKAALLILAKNFHRVSNLNSWLINVMNFVVSCE